MGHNFGLYHSRALDCGTTTLGSSCSSIEYGDYVDVMGATTLATTTRSRRSASGAELRVLAADHDGFGERDLHARGLRARGPPKALKILKSTDPTTGKNTWYYVEYRQAVGFDGFLASNANVLNGILIHTGSESSGNSSDLLDLTPATSAWSDPALVVGQSFNDPDAGVTITTAWATATEAGVTVELGPMTCAPANPMVALSPSQSQSVPAGTTVTYTVSVTNQDNAGCVASTFGLQAGVPAGWTAPFGTSSLTLSPGATTSTTVQVTSPASAAAGSYTIGVSATNSSAAGYTGSSSATYVIGSSLSLTVTTDQPSYLPNQFVYINGRRSRGLRPGRFSPASSGPGSCKVADFRH